MDTVTSSEPAVLLTSSAPGVAVITTNFAEKVTDTTGTTVGFAGAISATMVHSDSGWRFLVGHTSSVVPPVDTTPKPLNHRT